MSKNPFAPKMTEAQRREAMRRHRSGESLTKIAEDYGAPRLARGETLRKRGLVVRHEAYNRLRFPPAIEKAMARDFLDGKRPGEIAAERGISLTPFLRTLRKRKRA